MTARDWHDEPPAAAPPELESVIVGTVMTHPEAAALVPQLALTGDEFASAPARAAWHAILALCKRGQPIDSPAVVDELADRKQESACPPPELAYMALAASRVDTLPRHAERLRREHLTRRLRALGLSLADQAGDPERVRELLELAQELARGEQPGPARLVLPEVPVFDVATAQPEPQRWIWDGYIPCGHVSMLAGHGGVGKSLLALMLATAVALGRDFLGRRVERVRVLFFSAEDGAAVIRRRVAAICRAWGIDPATLDGWLFVIDASEIDAALFAERRVAGMRTGSTTPAYEALAAYIKGAGIRLAVIDNASDVFDADEIARALVRAFMRWLRRLITEGDGSVLLLGHVDKNTSRAGKFASAESYSGSTAWHNSARSRLHLVELEPGTLELQHQKSQFGPKLEPLRLVWPAGGLPALATAAPEQPNAEPPPDARRTLLRLVHEFTQHGEWVSTKATGPGNTATLLRTDARYPVGLKSADMVALLREAERMRLLRRVPYTNAERKSRERWELTPQGVAFIGEPPIVAAAAS